MLRDWFEDELRAFQGGKDGLMPCVWENEVSRFPQVMKILLYCLVCIIPQSENIIIFLASNKLGMSFPFRDSATFQYSRGLVLSISLITALPFLHSSNRDDDFKNS